MLTNHDNLHNIRASFETQKASKNSNELAADLLERRVAGCLELLGGAPLVPTKFSLPQRGENRP